MSLLLRKIHPTIGEHTSLRMGTWAESHLWAEGAIFLFDRPFSIQRVVLTLNSFIKNAMPRVMPTVVPSLPCR